MRFLCALAAWLVPAALLAALPTEGDGFPGWQALRVIHQQGNPDRMFAVDLDGKGRQAVVVVNKRQGRLDVYRWTPPAEREAAKPGDPARPNDLPMAPDWSHHEVPLDELPFDAVPYDLDGDKRPELLVLCGNPMRVLAFKQTSRDRWERNAQWQLLTGTPAGHDKLMLVRRPAADAAELLISFEQGIQVVPLAAHSRATWLSPRESRSRLNWGLVDLNGDGALDLVEWSATPHQTIRWFEAVAGKLLPAQVLYDHNVQGFGVLPRSKGAADLLLLGGTQEGLLRRFELSQGESTSLGRHDSLPMPGGTKAAWCGIKLGDRAAIVAADSSQPRLRVHDLTASGWQTEQSFPTLSNVKSLLAPTARPGMLLLWIKDGADLQQSSWQSNRLSYPQPFPGETDSDDRKIVALETVGRTTWWAQRVGAHLDLYTWPVDQEKPTRKRFSNVGSKGTGSSSAKIEKVVWLGGAKILAQVAYATTAKLMSVDDDGKVTTTEPANLAKVDLGEFMLFEKGGKPGEYQPARLTDGVLQWLGPDLNPVDQLMLPEGQKLAAFVRRAGETSGWALEQGGAFIHRLEPDKSGLLRVAESFRPPHAVQLAFDAVLGLVLIDSEQIIRLSPGRAVELKLLDSIDGRVGRPSGVKEATIHRILVADVEGRGEPDVLLCDDRRHQLTLLRRMNKELKSVASWQVFDDQAYPYGGGHGEARVTEPRAVVGFDGDGDGQQDLALICHDRVLIYLAREGVK
ncbi:MAG: hypothetical protein JSS27_21190 [Planctomycetes bacterium]|nr:hypothetical protein [Planctomycetota bacterium]